MQSIDCPNMATITITIATHNCKTRRKDEKKTNTSAPNSTRVPSNEIHILYWFIEDQTHRSTHHIFPKIVLLLADDRPCPELKLVNISSCLNTQVGRSVKKNSATTIKEFVSPSLCSFQVLLKMSNPETVSSSTLLRIAVIGGGPAGLTFARILQVHGLRATIYEQEKYAGARLQGGTLDLHTKSGLLAMETAGLMDQF